MNKSGKEKKREAKYLQRKQSILEQSTNQIAQIQTRPYISITEATVLFRISKNTLHRLIKAEKIPAVNYGQRLTRVSRLHIEAMFTEVVLLEEPKEQSVKLNTMKANVITLLKYPKNSVYPLQQ